MSHMTVKIGGDATQFRQALSGVRGEAAKAGKSIAGAIASPLGAALGGAGIAAGLIALGKSAINAADDVDKGSQKMQVSAESYQRLGQMANFAGSSIEQLIPAFGRMSRVIAGADEESISAQKSLWRIGLTLDDLKGKKPEEQFAVIAKRLSSVSDEATRSAAAQEIFGRGGVELLPLIKNYEELARQVENMPVMSDENVAAAARYKDSIDAIGQSIQSSLINSGIMEWLAETADKYDYILNIQGKMKSAAGSANVNYNQYEDWSAGKDVAEAIIGESSGTKLQTDAVSKDEIAAHKEKRDKRLRDNQEKERRAALEEKAKNNPSQLEDLYQQEKEYQKLAESAYTARRQAMKNPADMKLVNQASELENAAISAQKKLYANEFYETDAYKKSKPEFSKFDNAEEAARKKAEAEAERENQRREKAREAAGDTIRDMLHAVEIQTLLNDGKEREAAIQDAIYRAKERSSEITDDELKQVGEMAGELYDLTKNDKKETGKSKAPDEPQVTALEKIGAIFGGMGNKDGTRELKSIASFTKKTNSLLERIADKTTESSLGAV